MRWPRSLDKSNYQPKQGETRTAFLSRVAENGFPMLGYAEVLRAPVWELCREVTALRAEVETLRREVAALRDQ